MISTLKRVFVIVVSACISVSMIPLIGLTGSSNDAFQAHASQQTHAAHQARASHQSHASHQAHAVALQAKTYKVKYVLNGGKNAKANKSSYRGKLTLKNPCRKGYVFKGWYSNKKYTKRVKTVNNKNMTVYAKWAKAKAVSARSATVYVTPNGKVYHSTKNCRTLSRSKVINSMSRSKAIGMGYKSACKVCH